MTFADTEDLDKVVEERGRGCSTLLGWGLEKWIGIRDSLPLTLIC